jgi:hypothetical protein
MTRPTKPTKIDPIQTVISLREAAIRVVHKKGKWEKRGRGTAQVPIMRVKNHLGISILYKTPFQKGWLVERLRPRNGYYLEIHRGHERILAVYWDRNAPLTVETYTAGEWERKLCPVVSRAPSTGSRRAVA